MNRIVQQRTDCRWHRFSHKAYAVFRSLHCEVSIGVLGVAMLTSCSFVRPPGQQKLQTGDLLFCIEPQGSDGLGAAIAAVTDGVDGMSITHVAIVADPVRVLEASPQEGVRVINLEDFLRTADHDPGGIPLVAVGRLLDTLGIAASVQRAMQYVGRPYDFLYLPGDSALYCSELVQLSYRRSDGSEIFFRKPMSFSDSAGHILPYWQELYAAHQMQVPEGCLGTNPGDMSQSPALHILSDFKSLVINH